jgi:hypothetical protein
MDGASCCVLLPACRKCNRSQGVSLKGSRPPAERPPEPAGLPVDDSAWNVPWLDGLRHVPADAVWPRLMSAPHARAVGTYGEAFAAWTLERTGTELRWWQHLVAVRLLEVDAEGLLVWDTAVLTMARQLGKSWLLRELCLWRMHQGDLFGEPQLVLHTGRDLSICKEVQRPARLWAKALPLLYKVREVNGQEEIERLADGSRWILRAKDSVYGYSASLAGVDEAWKVPPLSIEEGLEPTMLERSQPQLLLISTAHRRATALMVNRRGIALSQLTEPTDSLLVEWSTPRSMALDDPAGWRLASPHWTDRRAKVIANRLQAAKEGNAEDEDETDPIEAFRAQWLNQWPTLSLDAANLKGELLVDGDAWRASYGSVEASDGKLWIGLEDYGGAGAAVAGVVVQADGRVAVDGWLCETWEAAVADVRLLASSHPGYKLLVGASLFNNCPADLHAKRAGTKETRTALPLLRQLVAQRQVVHEPGDLDEQVEPARVTRATDGSLLVLAGQRTDLLRAAAWCIQAALAPTKLPAIH